MRLRWKDIEADSGRWLGLAVDVELPTGSSRVPSCRLETGGNSRIRLMQGDAPLLWATPCSDYAGVRLLKTHAVTEHPIPAQAIDSVVLEKHRALEIDARLPAWSRLFAQALTESAGSFLYPGQWLFAGVRPTHRTWTFSGEAMPRSGGTWPIYGVRDALSDDPLGYVDWWHPSADLISLRRTAPADDGRLKWWRKKAREDALPPILVWYTGCLDAYVIADGHVRLQAALLEDRPPDFIVASSMREMKRQTDEHKGQAVIESLSRNDERQRHKRMSVEQMNALLIATFDNRPYLDARTHGWARIASDAPWVAEVKDRLCAIGRVDKLPSFVDRE